MPKEKKPPEPFDPGAALTPIEVLILLAMGSGVVYAFYQLFSLATTVLK